ncbi:MAG: DUF433 domain-containing protein [Blastocatellia bacterium]
MNNGQPDNPVIMQTSRGPSINGTRLTVYHIMDMLKYGRSPDYVQGWHHLTDEEMAAVMQYLKQNEEELEREYADILRRAEKDRLYWTERNKDRASMPAAPPANEKIALAREKLIAIKRERDALMNGQ